jgi:hypothetical protein
VDTYMAAPKGTAKPRRAETGKPRTPAQGAL